MKDLLGEKYRRMGFALLFAGMGIVFFYFSLKNFKLVMSACSGLVHILMPFIIGGVLAYLLCPIFNGVTRKTYHLLEHKAKSRRRAFVFAKALGAIAALLFLFGVCAGFFALLVPQLTVSIVQLVEQVPSRLTDLEAWVTDQFGASNPDIVKTINHSIDNASSLVLDFISRKVMPGVDNYADLISQGLIITIRTFINILVGVIAAVYFLLSKEKFKAEFKKMITAVFRRDHAEEIFHFGNFMNRTFGGFINGKIIDSIIIGFICYALMLILGLPYAELCSVIVGVTNIIPFFGPFIGAIPCSVIICVVSPIKAGIFILMIFGLQQFDGNILGPKILGETTGLASFWVMFSIILFGGLFGFVGMIIGVPTFAVIYAYTKRFIEKRLRMKGLPEETAEYKDFNKYDINRKDVL